MKDFIIGSDEFLVRAIKQIEQHVAVTSRPKHPLPNRNEQDLNEDDQRQMPLDKNRDFFNTTTGQTPLHFFNMLVKSIHACHDEISKRRRDANNQKIRNISIAIRNLKHEIKATRDPQEKTEANNRLDNMQRSLAMETEAREKAAQM
jgi:hypothetical protein